MTPRSVFLLVLGIAGAALGLLRNQSGLVLLSLTVILWIVAEWARFQWRVNTELASLTVRRTMNDKGDSTGVVFSGSPLRIAVKVACSRGQVRPFTRIRDVVPEILQVEQGSSVRLVTVADQLILFDYVCRPLAAGTATFPGCRVRIQDPYGFFIADRFVVQRQTLRILPEHEVSGNAHSQIKRINALPQHGIHQLQRAGLGSELLEIRQYVPGDPPKSIAWKVSARRDQLMTREYESDVPIRTVIFVEETRRVQRGPWGQRQCDLSARVAAGISQAALAAGDLAGLVLFSESATRGIIPGWGDRTLYHILERLADTCTMNAGPRGRWTPQLQAALLTVCQERWPELLSVQVNRVPLTVFPLLPWKHRARIVRSRLAGIVCQLHGLKASDWVRLVHDDEFMRQHAIHLLSEAGCPATPPLLDESAAAEVPIDPRSLTQLAVGIRQSFGRARDNERFIIVADLLHADESLDAIRPAVQLALARHHRVVFVCPLLNPAAAKHSGDDASRLTKLLREAWSADRENRQADLRRRVRTMGATIAFTAAGHPISLVLAQLQRKRRGRAIAGVH